MRADAGEEEQRAGADHRAERHGDARADALLRERAGAGGEQEHQHGHGEHGGPGGQRREPGDDLQVQHDEEEHAAQGGVDGEGDQVRGGEGPRGEDLQRQHRVGRAPFGEDEADHAGDADAERAEHDGGGGAEGWPGGESVGEPGQAGRAGERAHEVQPSGRVRVAGLRNVAERDRHDNRGERHVDQEDQPPAGDLDQPATEERAERAGDAAQAGPGPDRLGPVLRNGMTLRGWPGRPG